MVDWEASKEFGLPLSDLARSAVRAVGLIRKRPLPMRELLALGIGGELTAQADSLSPAGAFAYAPAPMDALVRLCRIVEAMDRSAGHRSHTGRASGVGRAER